MSAVVPSIILSFFKLSTYLGGLQVISSLRGTVILRLRGIALVRARGMVIVRARINV